MEDRAEYKVQGPKPIQAKKPHPDDVAIDRFCAAMKAKMALKRAEGRGGWEDPQQVGEPELADMLVDHIMKGDPIDIANFCMMLHQREQDAIEHHPCNGGQAKRIIQACVHSRTSSQPRNFTIVGRTSDGNDVDLPIVGDGTRDGKNLFLVSMPEGLTMAAIEMVGEVARAKSMWPPFNSAHEGYAVLAEEVDELWDEVKINQKKRDLDKMRKEAKQVGAMALRFMTEVCDEVTGRK